MATWDSRGLRGSQFETVINQANEKYRELRLGLVQKIPTPITPVAAIWMPPTETTAAPGATGTSSGARAITTSARATSSAARRTKTDM